MIWLKERLAKLLEVKSLISFIVLIPVGVMYLKGAVTNEVYIPITMAVVTYFFTKKDGESK